MILGDRHLVVVEDDDKVAVQLAGNVQALKRSPPDMEPSPITAMMFSLPPMMSRAFARPSAKLMDVEVWPILKRSCEVSAGSGVRRHRVVERGIHVCLLAAGEHLMRIRLVRDIVNDMVNGRVEYSVERNCCFDDAKVWTKVAAMP